MTSCDPLGYDQWPTLFLYYKLDIFLYFLDIFHKARTDGVPELLPKEIYTKHANGHSLRGNDCLVIHRFNNRYMKGFTYRESILRNTETTIKNKTLF